MSSIQYKTTMLEGGNANPGMHAPLHRHSDVRNAKLQSGQSG